MGSNNAARLVQASVTPSSTGSALLMRDKKVAKNKQHKTPCNYCYHDCGQTLELQTLKTAKQTFGHHLFRHSLILHFFICIYDAFLTDQIVFIQAWQLLLNGICFFPF